MSHRPIQTAVSVVAPHAGGTWAVYETMRAALAPAGVDLRWLGLCDAPDAVRADPRFAHALGHGEFVDGRGLSQTDRGRHLLERLRAAPPDAVFVNLLMSPADMSVAAYLPPSVARIMILHSITPGTYAAARALRPFVHAAVGVSPRIHRRLAGAMGMRDRSFCIPNAVDVASFDRPRAGGGSTLRLLYLGRVKDLDKGVFLLPHILRRLPALSVHLTVAGDGEDLPDLRRQCADLSGRVTFLGAVAAKAVPGLAASHDVLLMPSRFEGFGCVLVEAMAAGCVPVASRIRQVTDFVVRDGQTGLLFPIGNAAAAAAAVRRLAADRDMLARMSGAGRADVRERFSHEALRRGYVPVLDLAARRGDVRSRAGDPFELLRIGGGWRKWIPAGVKQTLRRIMYR
jgi:glycosyltransferase involved in cell wall biosynthesis